MQRYEALARPKRQTAPDPKHNKGLTPPKATPRRHRHSSAADASLPIKAIFLDVDGVLTDGRLYMDDRGRETKVFDTKDGHGIKMALAAGLKVAWISGRTSLATARRAKDLGVRFCYQGVKDKLARYEALCRRWRLRPEETAAIGDDEPDVPLLEAAGFSACPADATPPAQRAAQVLLTCPGGRGAVREFVERVLALNAQRR